MTDFFSLLEIYKWSIPACIAMSSALALIGAQWTARERSAQIFVLGQGSSLGVVMGLAINILLGTDFHHWSLGLGLLSGWGTLFLSDYLIGRRSQQNHIFLTLFILFLALTYLLTAITPSLETHMASTYFGDVAVMSDFASRASLTLGILFVVGALKYWRQLSLTSFQLVNHSWIHSHTQNKVFDLTTILLTTLSIQSMGYLFTIGSLFISTSFAAQRSSDLKSYTKKLLLISSLGSLFGFLLSLFSTNLPTVPCLLLGQIFMGLIFFRIDAR